MIIPEYQISPFSPRENFAVGELNEAFHVRNRHCTKFTQFTQQFHSCRQKAASSQCFLQEISVCLSYTLFHFMHYSSFFFSYSIKKNLCLSVGWSVCLTELFRHLLAVFALLLLPRYLAFLSPPLHATSVAVSGPWSVKGYATLHPALSIRWSVDQSVGWAVTFHSFYLSHISNSVILSIILSFLPS